MIQLQAAYNSKPFQILAFPCNQFGGQEPGTDEEIQNFISSISVNFPVFGKVKVNGKDSSELFKWLKENSNLKGEKISWNFGKFLVNQDSSVVQYFDPKTFPLDLTGKIEELF